MSFIKWFNSKPFGRHAKRIDTDETARLNAAYSAAESKCSREFNSVISFALDKAGQEADTFLRLWREGSFSELKKAFPEFSPPAEGRGNAAPN